MSSSKPHSTPIKYKVIGCSEHSGLYVADNIKYDRPHDQTSRWSSAKVNAIHGRSWVLIEMDSIAVLESITFGKFFKTHPCNMKDFEVHIGLSRDHMTEVLQTALKNDPKAETFAITHKSKDGVPLPTKFVKIVALSAHSPNFNSSIWYVGLMGIAEGPYVQRIEQHRETLAMRLIMKHLRQRRHITTYRQIQQRSGVQLEHPLVAHLYETLVLRGDWAAAESHLHELASANLFSDFIHSCMPRARWQRLRGTDANGDIPCRRGGHAMCMDTERGLIYLFGGYDGRRSLDDFWGYNVADARWRVISHSVGEEKNGPGPRACHKMVFDPKSGCIYVLGRLADSDLQMLRGGAPDTASGQPSEAGTSSESAQGQAQVRSAWSNRRSIGVETTNTNEAAPPSQPNSVDTTGEPTGAADRRESIPPVAQDFFSEFYRFRTRGLDSGKWELLHYDTAIVGGPKLIYDHQMVLDSEAQVLYVQGGRVVDEERKTPKFSGLYSYDLRSGKWAMIQAQPDSRFSPRFGHSMVFEPKEKKIFIFAGQKDDYLSDMWEFDIPAKSLTELFPNVTAVGGPEPCNGQRAVIDPNLKEIYTFTGTSRKNASKHSVLPVSLYKYDKHPGTWMSVPPAKPAAHPNASSSSKTQRLQPSPKRQRSGMESTGEGSSSDIAPLNGELDDGEPVARRACQVVYDSRSQTFYLHGGTGQAKSVIPRGAGFTAENEVDERLDDFWSMKLERPSPSEVIRRAMFETRRQQFREMCEETEPVTALAFLQNDVSVVVNHDDKEEASVFRSLLSHLFSQTPAPLSPPLQSLSSASTIPAFLRESSSLGEGVRSRGHGSPCSSKSGSGEWTSELKGRVEADEDTIMADATSSVLSRDGTDFEESVGDDDPYELTLRGGKRLSKERFEQRTAMFESLMRFVGRKSEGREKQPEGSLLDVLGDGEV